MLKKTTHGLTERTDVLFICKLTDHQMNVFAVNYKKCSSEESSLFDFCYAKHPLYDIYIYDPVLTLCTLLYPCKCADHPVIVSNKR